MARRKSRTPARASAARAGSTPPSISDQRLAEEDPGKLFTDDGLKAHDTERVGAMAPDTDPPDGGPRTYPPLRARPPRPLRAR
jgi:hypothetical protein